MLSRHLRTSFIMLACFTVITGLAYPLLITCVAHAVFPSQAKGSLIFRGGDLVGSSLIGQPFSDPKYFWGRLSATSPVPYNAASSTGSNYGPMNPALYQAVKDRIAALRSSDTSDTAPIPVDLVTSSGSGLDPDISIAAALYQVDRVARARGVAPDTVRAIVSRFAMGRQWGFLGEPRVNVLELNIALDDYAKGTH
jgi:K+-transporting ATPase ATPase C chain